MTALIAFLVSLSVFILLATILLFCVYIDSCSMKSNLAGIMAMLFIALLSGFITNLLMNSF